MFLLFVLGCSKTDRVLIDEITQKNHVIYYEGVKYTGIVFDLLPDDKLRFEKEYKLGVLDGLYKEWYNNGTLRLEKEYKSGVLDGIYKEWYPNGQIMYESFLKKGKFEGKHQNWFNNGQLSFEYNYSNGKIDGLCRDWKYNGQLFMETEYKDGIFFSEKCIDDSGDIIDCSIYLNKFSPIEDHYNPSRTSRHSECCDEENNSFLE